MCVNSTQQPQLALYPSSLQVPHDASKNKNIINFVNITHCTSKRRSFSWSATNTTARLILIPQWWTVDSS